jgi:hypothetical protein
MINRFRTLLYRAGLRVVPVDDLANISARLRELGQGLEALSGGMLVLRQAFERVPERVTVIAFGQREAEAGEVPIVVDSKTIRLRGDRSETITLETHYPVARFQVVVIANFERVELGGLFHRADLIGMQSPVGFGKLWHPGEQVRAVVRRLEVGA